MYEQYARSENLRVQLANAAMARLWAREKGGRIPLRNIAPQPDANWSAYSAMMHAEPLGNP